MPTDDHRSRAARRARGVARVLVVAVAAALVAGCAAPASATAPARETTPARAAVAPGTPGCLAPTGPSDRTASVLGREYLLHAPPGRDPRRPLPLVLAFHGAKQSARKIRDYSGLDRADAVVVYPQGRVAADGKRAWSPTDDLPDAGPDIAFVTAMVAAVGQAYCLDPTRVVATGKSQGAGFTHALACLAPGLVSAIAPVAGAFYRPGEHHGVAATRCASGPRRVLEIHGDADSVIAYGGTTRSRPLRTVPGADGEGWVDEWVARDGCRAEDPQRGGLPADVELHRWSTCAGGSEVTHYRLHGAGHTWPGSPPGSSGGGDDVTSQDLAATDVVLRFFGIGTS